MAKRKRLGALYIFLLILLFIASLYPLYKHLTDISGKSMFSQLKYVQADDAEESTILKSDGTKYQAFIGDSEKGEVSYKIYTDNLSFTETRDNAGHSPVHPDRPPQGGRAADLPLPRDRDLRLHRAGVAARSGKGRRARQRRRADPHARRLSEPQKNVRAGRRQHPHLPP